LLTEARQDLRRETAKVARLEEEREDYGKMERERDELRAMVDVLEERIGVLIVSEEEGKVWRGKSMQQAQALMKERDEHKKARRHAEKLKEGKEKPKERVEGGEEKAVSTSTLYRRATTISNVIVEVAENVTGNFARLWGVVMRKQEVKDAFSEAGLKPYHDEADVRETEMVDRVRDLVQWAKAHCGETHARQVYEALCTAVADPRNPKEGGAMYWVMKRLGIGAIAMQSGMGRRKVLDDSCFREGFVFNDDRYDAKTKNDDFPAEAQLQQLFWVEEVSRTSPNMGDVVRQCLGAKDDEGKATHVYVEEEGRTTKRRVCINGPVDLTEETDMARVVSEQARLSHVKCMKVRVRHKEMNDNKAYATFLASEKLKRHIDAATNAKICLALFTFSWFLSNKPIQVKFPSRNTSQCTHCEQAMTLGATGLQLHKKACLRAGETAAAGPAAAPPIPPGAVPLDHGFIHQHCGKEGGCACDHCVGGKCRVNHPFMRSAG